MKKAEKIVKGHNYFYYGYCIFLTNAESNLDDHIGSCEVSTGHFLKFW